MHVRHTEYSQAGASLRSTSIAAAIPSSATPRVQRYHRRQTAVDVGIHGR